MWFRRLVASKIRVSLNCGYAVAQYFKLKTHSHILGPRSTKSQRGHSLDHYEILPYNKSNVCRRSQHQSSHSLDCRKGNSAENECVGCCTSIQIHFTFVTITHATGSEHTPFTGWLRSLPRPTADATPLVSARRLMIRIVDV